MGIAIVPMPNIMRSWGADGHHDYALFLWSMGV
jgi:hypothetical protein